MQEDSYYLVIADKAHKQNWEKSIVLSVTGIRSSDGVILVGCIGQKKDE